MARFKHSTASLRNSEDSHWSESDMRKLETVYARTNKFTGEIVTGLWASICEHDKREYSDPVIINRDRTVKPLAIIAVLADVAEDGALETREIYTSADLVGVRLGMI